MPRGPDDHIPLPRDLAESRALRAQAEHIRLALRLNIEDAERSVEVARRYRDEVMPTEPPQR